MKKVLLVSIIFFDSFLLQAQYFKDEWGEIIPFSLTNKYIDIIKTDEIHSMILKPLDNDSLFFEYNNFDSYEEVGNAFCAGFMIDSLLDFRKNATKIEIDEGTLWIMTIESATAASIGVTINNLDLPEKTYFTVYPGTIPGFIQEPEVAFKEDVIKYLKNNRFQETIEDEKAVLEFFALKGTKAEPNIMIDNVIYGLAGLGKPGTKINFKELKEEFDNSK